MPKPSTTKHVRFLRPTRYGGGKTGEVGKVVEVSNRDARILTQLRKAEVVVPEDQTPQANEEALVAQAQAEAKTKEAAAKKAAADKKAGTSGKK